LFSFFPYFSSLLICSHFSSHHHNHPWNETYGRTGLQTRVDFVHCMFHIAKFNGIILNLISTLRIKLLDGLNFRPHWSCMDHQLLLEIFSTSFPRV
jgi:hypothetical protein